MTTSAHHGPIGRRLQIIDRLPARRDYLRTARLDPEFIDRRPGAHVIATQARRSRARVARRSRSTTGGSAAGDALVRNHEPAENRANDVIAEGARRVGVAARAPQASTTQRTGAERIQPDSAFEP